MKAKKRLTMKTRCSIIGEGQLGLSLMQRLSKRDDFNVRVFSRKSGFDINDISTLKDIMKISDVVINCAAMTNVDLCNSVPDQAIMTNGAAPGILGCIASFGSQKVIHISSDYVYGNEDELMFIPEDHSMNPVNVYGLSKKIGDSILTNNKEIKDRLLILRPSWLFSLNGRNSIIARIYQKLKESRKVDAAPWMHGVPTSCKLVSEVSELFIDEKLKPGLYNIRNGVEEGETPTVADLANVIADEMKDTVTVHVTEAPQITSVKRQSNCLLDISELQTQLPSDFIIKNWKNAVRECIKIWEQ